MTKRNKLMFLKNKALAVFRFGYKEDPEAGKEGLKGTDGISPEDLSKLNKKDTK